MTRYSGSSALKRPPKAQLPRPVPRPDGLTTADGEALQRAVNKVAPLNADVPLGSETLAYFLAELWKTFRQALRDENIAPGTGQVEQPLWEYAKHILWMAIDRIRRTARTDLKPAEGGPRLFGQNSLDQWTGDNIGSNRGWAGAC